MLNLLPWIFFTLRGLGILVKPKKNETESHDYEVDNSNNCTEQNSLDDVLEDTTWQAVNGLSPKFDDLKKLSLDSVDRVETLVALDASFGDVFDEEDNIKNAILIRSQSELNNDNEASFTKIINEPANILIDETILLESSDALVESTPENGLFLKDECKYLRPQNDEEERAMRKDSWDSLKVECNNESHRQLSVTSNEVKEAKLHNHGTIMHGLEKSSATEKIQSTNEMDFTPKKTMIRAHVVGQDKTYKESPKAIYNEFDDVMQRRKLHTDTMHKISDTLGHFGNRDVKIYGSPSKRSLQLWQKVRQAVTSRKYISLQDPPVK